MRPDYINSTLLLSFLWAACYFLMTTGCGKVFHVLYSSKMDNKESSFQTLNNYIIIDKVIRILSHCSKFNSKFNKWSNAQPHLKCLKYYIDHPTIPFCFQCYSYFYCVPFSACMLQSFTPDMQHHIHGVSTRDDYIITSWAKTS